MKSRAFACAMPRCNQALTSKLNLVRHMTRVHEGRPHRCTKCPRGFRSAGSLKKHLRAAHGDTDPLICHACAICFGRRSVLENHVLRMHSGRMPPPDAQTSFLCPGPRLRPAPLEMEGLAEARDQCSRRTCTSLLRLRGGV